MKVQSRDLASYASLATLTCEVLGYLCFSVLLGCVIVGQRWR